MSRKVNKNKLLEKIAAFTGMDIEETKEKAKQLYSYEESILEAQSVLNYYEARIQPRQRAKESDADYEKRYNEWKIRKCAECNLEFAYAYSVEGVKYCSLDCLDGALRKIGLQVTYGRPLKLRWGLRVPAIVPSSAFGILQSLEEQQHLSSQPSSGEHSEHAEISHP